jgi:hypothetical protein
MNSFDYNVWTPTWYESATEEQRLEFREWLVSTLKDQRVNVTFRKLDGTDRLMHCTLHESFLPMKEVKEVDDTKAPRKKSTESVAVWDIDKSEWRAFRLDAIREFSFNLGDLHV